MITTTKRPRRARSFHAGVEGLEGRLLLTGGGQYIGGGWNPGNWGVLGAIGGAYDSVVGGLAEVPGTIYQLPGAIGQTFTSGAAADSVGGYVVGLGDHFLRPVALLVGVELGQGGPLYGNQGAYDGGHIVGDGTGYVGDIVLIVGGGLGGFGGAGAAGAGGAAGVGGGVLGLVGSLAPAVNVGAVLNGGLVLVGTIDAGYGILDVLASWTPPEGWGSLFGQGAGAGGAANSPGQPTGVDFEQAVQAEWALRGDATAEAMSLQEIGGPHQVANLDPALGPNQVRYQAQFLNESTGEIIDVSINYDPITGMFGTIKPASGR